MAAPLVKWSTEARRLEALPRIVHRAVKTAFAHLVDVKIDPSFA